MVISEQALALDRMSDDGGMHPDVAMQQHQATREIVQQRFDQRAIHTMEGEGGVPPQVALDRLASAAEIPAQPTVTRRPASMPKPAQRQIR